MKQIIHVGMATRDDRRD